MIFTFFFFSAESFRLFKGVTLSQMFRASDIHGAPAGPRGPASNVMSKAPPPAPAAPAVVPPPPWAVGKGGPGRPLPPPVPAPGYKVERVKIWVMVEHTTVSCKICIGVYRRNIHNTHTCDMM